MAQGATLLEPTLSVEGGARGVVLGRSACYLDPVTGEVGPLQLDVRPEDADAFLSLPSLLPNEASVVAQMLQQSTLRCRAPVQATRCPPCRSLR